jgi:hypothetical protein
MKNLALLVILSGLILSACSKKEPEGSVNFVRLTGHVWSSDSLLVNMADASGPGQMLEKFKGDMKFEKGGTGTFGQYSGTWWFSDNETNIVIVAPELTGPLTANIVVLSASSLKITTTFPNLADLNHPFNIRMTFKPK